MRAILVKRLSVLLSILLISLILFQSLIIKNNGNKVRIKLKYGRLQPGSRRENSLNLKVRYENPAFEEEILETTKVIDKIPNFSDKILDTSKPEQEKPSDMKYILQWTSSRDIPFLYMGKGQQGFIDRKCPYTNCIVTSNRSYLGDYTKFDVIAFSGPQILWFCGLCLMNVLPKKRSLHQKYVFATIESADNYPVCSNRFDSYFNWTWTYKLDSEVRWGYMTIKDNDNNIIGPNKQMNWIKLENMEPVSEDFKIQLRTKSKAAAWFVSNCNSKRRREVYVQELQEELNKFKLEVDVYGKCGKFNCSRDNEDQCSKLIKDTYYFYLVFENSFGEDYVTEKLLRALQNNAVPIVYGGANYSRFMPNGIYLNARELGVPKLAKIMNDLINDPEQYSEYFKWKKYYSYYRQSVSVKTEPYCLFCTILNDKEMV